MQGSVYLMNAPNNSSMIYKIGMTTNLKRRCRELSRAFFTPVEVIHSVYVEDMEYVEMLLHEMFQDHRYDGEWFLLSDSHVRLWSELARIFESTESQLRDGR